MKSREEKAAGIIADLLSDIRLNLDLVGVYLARHRPRTNYNRLQEVADSAYFERERETTDTQMPDDIEERFKLYAQD